MVPDVVEELEIAPDQKALEAELLRMTLSESSDHALEQALLLKEKYASPVTVVTLESPEVDDVLYTALAKGADRAIKLIVEPGVLGTRAAAQVFADFLTSSGALAKEDALILCGSQAIDDVEGELGPCLAALLKLPSAGVVTGLNLSDNGKQAVVIKEFFGGLRGQLELPVPAVLGIQAAEKPPRYVPVAKVRAAMKTAKFETLERPAPAPSTIAEVTRMYKPIAAGRAEMIEGGTEAITNRLVGILADKGFLSA